MSTSSYPIQGLSGKKKKTCFTPQKIGKISVWLLCRRWGGEKDEEVRENGNTVVCTSIFVLAVICCDRILIGYVQFRAPSSWWSEAFGQDENTKQVHPTNFIHLELCVSSINHASFPIRVAPRAAHLFFWHIKVIVKHVRPMPANTVLATCGANAIPHSSQNMERPKSKPDTSESFSVDGGGGSWCCWTSGGFPGGGGRWWNSIWSAI